MFERYIGIDYSGAQTPTSSLPGLRVYLGKRSSAADEVLPLPSSRKYWTRKGLAEWLVSALKQGIPTFVGIDHAFSFPREYFFQCGVSGDWSTFLDDFQLHWPTDGDDVYVQFVRDGICGAVSLRRGNSRWRRITELRARTGHASRTSAIS